MAGQSWDVDLGGGRHRVEVVYGYWLGAATVSVDGRVVHAGRPIMQMSANRGVDIPIALDGHDLRVSIRIEPSARFWVTRYLFGLSVDGVSVPGTEPMAALPSQRYGPRFLEIVVWAGASGGVIGLSGRGRNPGALLFLAVPFVCSLIIHRTELSTRVMALACIAIYIVGIVAVAVLGAALAR